MMVPICGLKWRAISATEIGRAVQEGHGTECRATVSSGWAWKRREQLAALQLLGLIIEVEWHEYTMAHHNECNVLPFHFNSTHSCQHLPDTIHVSMIQCLPDW
jgi:hypothetical protein